MIAQHVQIATLTLSGQKPGQIAKALGISAEEVTGVMKSRSYRRIESDLAEKMLEGAGSELQALAQESVDKLRSMIRIPPKNLRGKLGLERKLADPNLLREQRLACVAILELAAKTAEKKADVELEKTLQAGLSDTDLDD